MNHFPSCDISTPLQWKKPWWNPLDQVVKIWAADETLWGLPKGILKRTRVDEPRSAAAEIALVLPNLAMDTVSEQTCSVTLTTG